MSVSTAKRLAASILKVGENRIKIAGGEDKAAAEVLTRDDVRGLIDRGAVYAEAARGVSRLRGRMHAKQRALGRRTGRGNRKGKRYASVSQKEQWMQRVRAQRTLLCDLFAKGMIDQKTYRHTYSMIKGGNFKSRASMLSHLRDGGLLKEKSAASAGKAGTK
ncbi:MAG: 50S ribosomal protein L19e [Candidatus Burarchaeum sp.]|nr:50S ribosomal protein L19e [Candidatus Burarchaeum sp.]MDO8339377.1 50S ribosomal protein L19e [Candidatus Burarchaeum sp.]